jgi:hypothetical protein
MTARKDQAKPVILNLRISIGFALISSYALLGNQQVGFAIEGGLAPQAIYALAPGGSEKPRRWSLRNPVPGPGAQGGGHGVLETLFGKIKISERAN